MDAITLLKTDHQHVTGLLGQLDDTTERAVKTRATVFAELKTALDGHAHIEETIFYPALEELEATRDITLEAIEEHRVMKRLLGELDAAAHDTEQWTAKLTVLKETVEHHVEEEEGDMFPKARKALGAEELATLGERMKAARNNHRRNR